MNYTSFFNIINIIIILLYSFLLKGYSSEVCKQNNNVVVDVLLQDILDNLEDSDYWCKEAQYFSDIIIIHHDTDGVSFNLDEIDNDKRRKFLQLDSVSKMKIADGCFVSVFKDSDTIFVIDSSYSIIPSKN